MTWTCWISGDDALVADHVVLGRAILPGAGLIDRALAGAEALLGQRPRRLRDLRLASPLPAEPGERVELTVELGPAEGADHPIHLTSRRDGRVVRHLHGYVSLSPPEADAARRAPPSDPPTVGAAEFYTTQARCGLGYGPAYQAVEAGWRRSSDHAIVRVRRPASAAPLGAFTLHPGLLDGAFQSATLLLDRGEAVPAVPYRVRSLALYAPLPERLYAEVRRVSDGDGPQHTLQYELYDEGGALCVSVELVVVMVTTDGAGIRSAASEPAPPADPLAAVDQLITVISGVGILSALRALGATRWADPADLARRLGVASGRRGLLELICAYAEEDDLIRQDGSGWALVAEAPPPGLVAELIAEGQAALPEHAAALGLLGRALDALPGVLTGRQDPLAVLFPGGRLDALEEIYRDAPVTQRINRALAQVLPGLLARRPAGPLQALEIGAGTGGTTAALLPMLSALLGGVEYTATDVGEVFLAHQRRRFSGQPGFSARLFDVERPPDLQGLPLGGLDLVVGAHVLHATRHVGEALKNARALLKPGGVLLLIEMTRPAQRWSNLIFGLTDGWWRLDGQD
ncbi:polyketide synthase dehydratase domain-containing protein, partial [Myxococcota bacterium]|nr:polyketide synthase dehydratase domain-containing protein [Myxococcota bacterium]